MTAKPKVVPLLAVVLAASLALRVWDASQGLNASRYFDERFNLKNVEGLLGDGEIRPRQAYYPTLAYLPQTAVLAVSQGLHRLTGIEALAVFGATSDGFTPTAYLLCRLTNAAFGLLSLWLVFLVGRRIWGPEVGLLAAAILGAFARHILASVEFKPDILVILLTLVTFWWTLDAAESPSRRRYLLVGLGVGLTAAAKYTGAVACLPLVALALWQGWRDRRRLGWLVGAGLASVLTFIALNPYLGMVSRYFLTLVHGYGVAGVKEKSDHWVVFVRQVEFLIDHHGAFVAVCLGVGLAALVFRLARGRLAGVEQTGAVLALALLLGHSVLHALVMTLFRGQNYLPVVPFSSLVAAWALWEAWRALSGLRPEVVVPLTTLFLAGVCGGQVTRQLEIVYQRVVPTNWEVANRALVAELDPLHVRHVAYEKGLGAFSVGINPRRPIVSKADRLPRLGSLLLDLADAEAFPLARREDAAANLYGARQARVPLEQVTTVASRPFRSRGEAVVVVRHPWRADGEPVALALTRPEGSKQVAAALPPLPSGTVVQLELWVPKRGARIALGEVRLDPGGRAVALFDTGRRRDRFFRVTQRFVLGGSEARVRIPLPANAGLDGYGARLWTWVP